MISLKELVLGCPDKTDYELLCEYILQDEIFDETVKLLTDVCQRKIRATTDYINRTHNWLQMPNAFYYGKYGTDIGKELDYMTRKMQMEEPLDEDNIEFLKSVVPTIPIAVKGNRMFWAELYDYIHNELKLKFKDEE